MNTSSLTTITGGITAPKGFLAAGVSAGIKKQKKDISIIFSQVSANTAAVFTKNKAAAACITTNKEQLKKTKKISAIVINSGNANACTGKRGILDTKTMIKTTANALGIPHYKVLVASTGVIGQFLPMDKIVFGIRDASKRLHEQCNIDAAEGICTTDTYIKECAVEFLLGEKTVRIGGMAKGSGMIAPNMATMLAFITTDINIPQPLLEKTFKKITDTTFNRITVDGETSTNDMAVILANGKANNTALIQDSANYKIFYEALEYVLTTLSKMIVKDGEGATKFVEVTVKNALNISDAEKACKGICNSPLVKTAIHGEDANWGRIIAALGNADIDFNPETTEIHFGNLKILGENYDISFSEEEAKKILQQKEITITIDLHKGKSSATFWTCDLSKNYIHINASYRS